VSLLYSVDLSPTLDTLNLFCQVVLARHDTREPVPMILNRGTLLNPMIGTTNVSRDKISNPSGDPRFPLKPFGVFAFPDLSVRHEGLYCLMFHLFELVGTDIVHHTSINSNTFRVYPAKDFNGMPFSTPFTELLKNNGVRVRVTKSVRVKQKFSGQKNELQQWRDQEFDPDPMVTDLNDNTDEQTGLQRYSPSPPPPVEPLLPPPAHSGPPSNEAFGRSTYEYQAPPYSPPVSYGRHQGLPSSMHSNSVEYSHGNFGSQLPPITDMDPRPYWSNQYSLRQHHEQFPDPPQASLDEHPNGADPDGHQYEPPPSRRYNYGWDRMEE
jgi:hypothetical protein